MLKEILKKLGVDFAEDISDEDAKTLIESEIDKKDEHINDLEAEKENLSKSNEELSASVEGIKADKEKVDKELSETKGRLTQVTEMYKEQFTQPSDKQEVESPKSEKELGDDVLQQILDTK